MSDSVQRNQEVIASKYEHAGHNWSSLWESVLEILRTSLAEHPFQTWIRPLSLASFQEADDGLKVRIEAPNDFSARWVREHYAQVLQNAFERIVQKPCDLGFEVGQEELVGTIVETPAKKLENKALKGFAQSKKPEIRVEDRPDARFRFDNFVVGESNQFAHASALAVAENLGKQYNPLFIYSPPGLGKTHLLHAIGNQALKRNPNAKIIYLSAERFVNELVDAIHHRKMVDFRIKYREKFDLILIDDIQFLAGKSISEEEFFHTFNALYNSKRQIVLSSDRSSKEIQLEDRIKTRFEWGLIAEVHPPDPQIKAAVLRAKAERDDIYLPDDVTEFIALQPIRNIRELEGVLIRLEAQASLTGAEISLEMARQGFGIGNRTRYLDKMSLDSASSDIQMAVAKAYNLKPNDLRSLSRQQNISIPRQVAMFLMRKWTKLGLREIGGHFGRKDHTTVMYACQKIEKEIKKNPQLARKVEEIEVSLSS